MIAPMISPWYFYLMFATVTIMLYFSCWLVYDEVIYGYLVEYNLQLKENKLKVQEIVGHPGLIERLAHCGS